MAHLERLDVVHFRLRFRFARATLSGPSALEAWLGAIKNSMSRLFPQAFEALLAARHDDARGGHGMATNSVVPGFVLDAVHGGDGDAEEGPRSSLEVRLFGRAAGYLPVIAYSLLDASQRGVGRGALPFALDSLCVLSPDGGWVESAIPVSADEARALAIPVAWLVARVPALPEREHVGVDRVALVFDTRLRMTVKGRWVDATPAFADLFDQLVERANRVGRAWGEGILLDDHERAELLRRAGEVRATRLRSGVLARRMRPSARQGRAIPSHGFKGVFAYEGRLDPFVPWLRLGEILHLGQQTTAGLGGYRLLVPPRVDASAESCTHRSPSV